MNQPQHILRTSIAVIGIALSGATVISGCTSAPPEPESMQDPQADFSAYKTFALKTDASAGESGQPVSLVDGYIRKAITAELTRKGYVEAPAGTDPDLRIDYEAVRAEKLKNNPFRIGIGVGGYGSNTGGSVGVGSSSVKSVNEGTLVVHVIDPARNAEVWRGRASRELGKGNIEPHAVQGVVVELLRDFPARADPP